ncbi:MAG: hypothetical protein PF570_09645 [Candidatus Cloacimonetes bacterium]|jgi:hypothetical protein|nr:hypothetical protein [Candidatus Cloacimonadota bacterium]
MKLLQRKFTVTMLFLAMITGLFAFAGGDGTNLNPYQVSNIAELDSVRYFLSSNFVQVADIDLGVAPWNLGAGWIPIGNATTSFTGNYDGDNYTISNLYINNPLADVIGLFGYNVGGTLENINLINVDITGLDYVGALVGYSFNGSSITNCTSSGSVNGNSEVGGLVGYNDFAAIANCTSSVNVLGNIYIGGLVGTNDESSINSSHTTSNVVANGDYIGGLVGYNYTNSTISGCSSIGTLEGANYIGGLIGFCNGSTVLDSYANVTTLGNKGKYNDAYDCSGGLIGLCESSAISNSYSLGSASGTDFTGGLIGYSEGTTTISNCYSDTEVEGALAVGGLIGEADFTEISNSYATGSVVCTGHTYTAYAGGLIGYDYISTITNCYSVGSVTAPAGDLDGGLMGIKDGGTTTDNYWDTQTSGQATSDGGTGKTTAEMQTQSTFVNWDFSTPIWKIHSSLNSGYPYLEWEGRIPIDGPENIAISYSPNTIIITWDPVTGASGYLIYSSDDPYGIFTVDTNGFFSGEEWTVNLTVAKRFYKVTAINPTKE